jgi:hypothetical protein
LCTYCLCLRTSIVTKPQTGITAIGQNFAPTLRKVGFGVMPPPVAPRSL